MSIFRNDFAKILAKPHPNCHVVCGKLPPNHNDLVHSAYEKDGRRHAMGKAAKYMGYKSLREDKNLAVKGILSGRDIFVTGSPRASEG